MPQSQRTGTRFFRKLEGIRPGDAFKSQPSVEPNEYVVDETEIVDPEDTSSEQRQNGSSCALGRAT